MPLDEEWNIEDELQQRKDLLKKYEQNSKLLEAMPIRDWEPERPTENLDFKVDSTEKAITEATYLAQGSGDHPNMRTASKQLHKMPTPDQAEEQGIIGQYLDGGSDFSLDHKTDTIHLMYASSNWREIGRANFYKSEYPFYKPCKDEEKPPFPSAPTYDAKAWKFVKEHAKPNALFWNVAG